MSDFELGVSFDTQSLKSYISYLDDLQKGDELSKVIEKSTTRLEKGMKKNARFVKGYATGETKDSIKKMYVKGSLKGIVGPSTEHAIFLEEGTDKMAAQPFVGKSLDEEVPKLLHDMRKLVK